MMKILLTAFISLGLIGVSAQEKPIAKIHYIFKHVNDTTQKDKQVRDEVVTYLGQLSSYYTSYSSTRAQEQIAKMVNAPDFDGNLSISRSTSAIIKSYFLEPTKSTLMEVRRVASDEFLLKAPFPKQEWDIHDDTKVLGGYTCQKATTIFGGRQYTAWFTTDIPFSFGPWKLHGLPGLILAAKDDKNEVEFEYAGFDKLADDEQITIGLPEGAIMSTDEEVSKLAMAFKANREAYFKAKSGSKGVSVGIFLGGNKGESSIGDPNKIKSINIKNADDYTPSTVNNNPLELKP
jgi:GLPGLI family protein